MPDNRQIAPLPAPRQMTAPPSLPRLLQNWTPGNTLPSGLTRHDLVEAKSDYDIALIPVCAKAFGVAMDRLMEFARAFGIPADNVAAAVGFYRQALHALPADLVLAAVDRIIAQWKWGNRMPLPADLQAKVFDDLTARRSELARIEAALRAYVDPDPPVSLEERQRMGEKLGELARSIGKGMRAP